jgi:N-acetylglucosamine-6-phosphate deacetylase
MFQVSTQIITNAQVVLPQGQVLANHAVWIENGFIKAITPAENVAANLLSQQDNIEVMDAQQGFLTPGLIDQQINGAFGVDFSQCTLQQAQEVLTYLPAHGITSILPTVVTAPLMDMVSAVNTLEETIHLSPPNRTRMIGVHIEGPFFNPQAKGCHPAEYITTPDMDDVQILVSPNTKLMTLAPETDPEGELVHFLFERGVRVCAGHSMATPEQMDNAIAKGLRGVSHLFNAMQPLHHRTPNLLSKALQDDRLYTSLIADGVHVDKDMLFLALRCKNPRALILISDAMALAGLAEGATQEFAGQMVTNQGAKGARNADGSLAGSTTLLNETLRLLHQWKILPFTDAIHLATLNPAEFLGFGNRLGQIAPGFQADLVLWHPQTLEVQRTWIDGQCVYQQGSKRNGQNPSLAMA